MINFGTTLAAALPKSFLLEFDEGVRAAGRRAKEVTKSLEVSKRHGGRVGGQIRTALVEQLLVRSAESAGFEAEEAGAVEGTEIYLYQAFAQVGRAIVVRATISSANPLPSPNKSRKRLVEAVNAAYSRDLFRPVPQDDAGGPIAVFFVVTPNPAAVDGIGGINVAVVDDRYDHYLFDEPFEEFLARYATVSETTEEVVIKPRKISTPYVAPEEQQSLSDPKTGSK